MSGSENVFSTLRDWMKSGGAGLVTRAELQRLEERVEELEELVDDIEAALDAREAKAEPSP